MMNKGAPETPDAMDTWFFNNVKDNLHLSICFSPLSKNFKDYCRSYPALINNTTIDWFMKWPEDALNEVALKFISAMDVDQEMVHIAEKQETRYYGEFFIRQINKCEEIITSIKTGGGKA